MHTPCPTPVINNQDKSRTGVTRCTILVCILLLVTLRTPCTLYWASLIHRFDRFDRCWCAILTIHSLSPFLVSPSPLSCPPAPTPSFFFFFVFAFFIAFFFAFFFFRLLSVCYRLPLFRSIEANRTCRTFTYY